MLVEEFVGYESLINFMEERALQNLEGDIIEIGAYMGGGTVKLAKFAGQHGKKVYAVDTFDPGVDRTIGKGGVKACEVYEAFLYGRSMLEVYQETTRGFNNIITIRRDSRKVRFPERRKFLFGFVDGCHQMSYVENDFGVIWPHLVSGGVIGFHDYGFDDWPEVTPAVDGLIDAHKREIRAIHAITGKSNILCMMLIKN
jgi:hypothetical protein